MEGLISSLRSTIGHPIIPRGVITGRFTENGINEIAVTCEDGNILIYNGGKSLDSQSNPKVLGFKEEIVSVIKLSWGKDRIDFIGVGTSTSVQVYNAFENVSLFYKKLEDGLSTLAAGFMSGITESWLLCGGECSFTGFNIKGEETYWNVASDTISSICFADLINKGRNQAIVGTVDNEISIFDAEELVDSRTETSPVLLLTTINSGHIAYATENGTIGVYKGLDRIWRVKSKSIASCQGAYKVNNIAEGVLTGWMNGRWELRKLSTGEMIYKNQLKSSIASIITGSFNQSHEESILVFDAQGEFELFTPLDIIKQAEQKEKLQNETVRKLTNQTNAFKLELNALNEKQNYSNLNIGERAALGIIPSAAQVKTVLHHSNDRKLIVEVEATHDLVIFLVVLLSDGMFKNSESKIALSRGGERFMKIPVENISRLQSEICLKATVGYPGSEIMHVLEDVVTVPRFAQFVQTTEWNKCNERVEFTISERMQRMVLWVRENFLLAGEIDNRMPELKLSFVSDDNCLNIHMKGGKVILETRSIRLAADIIQSMGSYFAFSLLRSTCHFSDVMSIPNIFKDINLIQNALSRMDAEIAELSQRILADMVRLEDGRVMEDYLGIETTTNSVRLNNNELIQKYRTKELNQQQLVSLLKKLNSIIDSGSKLRVGSPSSEVLSVCRLAVKNRKPEVITNAILHGVQ